MEEVGKLTDGVCGELLRQCADEIGISMDAIDKSQYRDSLLEMLERVAVAKIRTATEASRRADEEARRRRALSQMNASAQANAMNQNYCSG